MRAKNVGEIDRPQVSMSLTFYTRFFCTIVFSLLKVWFWTNFRTKKHTRKMLMKLTAGGGERPSNNRIFIFVTSLKTPIFKTLPSDGFSKTFLTAKTPQEFIPPIKFSVWKYIASWGISISILYETKKLDLFKSWC